MIRKKVDFNHKEFDELTLQKLKPKISKKYNDPKINGVYYKKLIRNVDERGNLTEIWSQPWSKDEPVLDEVKHVYFNTTHEGIRKGWHVHEQTFSQYTCVHGKMQVVLIDIRKNSKTYGTVDQFLVGVENPSYIKIPPGVLKAWKSLKGDSIIVNLLSTSDVTDNYKYPIEALLNNLWLNL